MSNVAESVIVDGLSAANFHELVSEKLRNAVRLVLTSVLEEEVTAVVGVGRYEQGNGRRDYRNGSYRRDLLTGVGPIEELVVPRTRQGYQTQVFARYQRRQQELDAAMVRMFVSGSSTTQVGKIVHDLTGSTPSASAVSRVFQSVQDEYKNWKERPLAAHYRYVFADGTYFTIIYENEGVKSPVLAVTGIDLEGKREVLAFSTGDRENQSAWEELLEQLKRRGVQTIDLWVTDGNQAMLNAIATKFPTAQRQRCVAHKLNNVLGYIPKQQHEKVEPALKAIFYQDSRQAADKAFAAFCEKYAKLYPTAVECLQRDGSACLTFYAFPKEHWKTIRTNNVSERLFEEVKKRSKKMAAAFRTEDSCLLLFYAVIRSLSFKRIPLPA
jgi:putative transposase